jgi:uncharacterized protein YdhG (YjbR/CyaY superfamily)
MEHWFAVMKTVADRSYSEQMVVLQEEHGFSRAHANALVMFSRGSGSAKRFATLDDYLADADPRAQATVRAIFAALLKAQPGGSVVIAWNHPQLKVGDTYLFGVSLAKKHLLIAPWNTATLEVFRPRLESAGYTVNKKTIRVPLDWDVDVDLLTAMVADGSS